MKTVLSSIGRSVLQNIADNRPFAIGYTLVLLATSITIGIAIIILDTITHHIDLPEFTGNSIYATQLIGTIFFQAICFIIACLIRRFWQFYIAEVVITFIGMVLITSFAVMSSPNDYEWFSLFKKMNMPSVTSVVMYSYPIIAYGLCFLSRLPLPQSCGWKLSG